MAKRDMGTRTMKNFEIQDRPLWLWREVQALPWSTEIVALTCVPRIACDPRRPYSSVHGKLVVQHRPKTNKRWNAAAFEQSQFFDHTGRLVPSDREKIAGSGGKY